MTTPPDALLFLAPGCPHCPAVLAGLSELLKEGSIGKLEAVNLAVHPEGAAALGVKSVPWLRLGPFDLEGAHTPGELRTWANGSHELATVARYCHDQLITGRRDKVEALLQRQPEWFAVLPALLRDTATSMAVRIGIGAVLEEFQGRGLGAGIVPDLAAILANAEPRTRADAAYYLSLIGGAEALAVLRGYLTDADPEIREIAEEALAEDDS